MPEPQYEIKDDRGVVIGRVDFAWPELGVFLEFDGKVKYEKLLKPGERALRRRDQGEEARGPRTSVDWLALHPSHLGRPRSAGAHRGDDSHRARAGNGADVGVLLGHFMNFLGCAVP